MKKIYAITIGFEYEEYADLVSAKKSNPIYIVEFTEVGIHTSSSDNKYELYSLDVYDNNLERNELIFGRWKIIDISKPHFSWGSILGSANKYSISDPVGRVNIEYFGSIISEFIRVLKRMLELSKNDSWQQYELSKENKELKFNVDKLNNDIEELGNENSELRKQLETFKEKNEQ